MPKVAKWFGDAVEDLMGSRIPLMKVIDTEFLNLNIKKIKFQGNISDMDFQLGYAVAVRVSDTEYRNYTVSFEDASCGVLEIIVHLHNDASGSRFMDKLVVGDEIRISMPRGKRMYEPFVNNYLLFGDETSLGLACAFQRKVQKEQQSVLFCLELDKDNDEIPRLLGLENYTLFPKHTFFQNEDLVNQLSVFKIERWQESSFVLTGNAKSVQTIRKSLKKRQTKGKIFAQAYWAEGKTGL